MPNRIGSALVDSTAEPAVAIDEHMTIVGWNAGAERLFGRPADDVLGKPCNEIVSGLDAFGNRYCDEGCVLMKMVQCRESVHRMRLDIHTSAGERVPTAVLSFRLPGAEASAFTLLHTFLPEVLGPRSERPLARGARPLEEGSGSPHPRLTTRELQILRELAGGASTKEIASALAISPVTVRNHVQHLLHKLGVHSKTAAVALALRHRLV
jgi:PAS domain S-box-containing protein